MNKMQLKSSRREKAILDALRAKPMTTQQIADAIGASNSSVAIYLRRLLESVPAKVYVSRYEPNLGKYAGRPAPIYSAGNKKSVEFVPLSCPVPKISSAERRAKILELLEAQPMTVNQLAVKMFIVRGTVSKHMTALRNAAERQVYIKSWDHPSKVAEEGKGGDWAPVYAVGDKKDKPKPKQETPSQRHKRLSKDQSYVLQRRLKRRLRYNVEKLRGKPQGIFAALGL